MSHFCIRSRNGPVAVLTCNVHLMLIMNFWLVSLHKAVADLNAK